MSAISSDTAQLRKLAAQLRKSSPELTSAVRRAVRDEGKKIAQNAANKASWSTRIPSSVKVSNSGLIGVTIRAGGDSAPHAKPYEHDGLSGQFRHPLNYPSQGSRQHWVSQNSRPFLHPAAAEKLMELKAAILEAALVALNDKLGERL